MSKTYEARVVRVDDYVAETLERDADRMPPSYAEQAAILREQARVFRSSSSTNVVRLWEEKTVGFQRVVNRELPPA